MRHHVVSRRLGVKTGHRKALLRNMLKSLVRDGRIRTTVARAKVLRSYVEPLVTKLKDPTVANVRYVASILNDRNAAYELTNTIAPKFKTRNGGYLRILKLAKSRPGDNADMALIEWVDEGLVEAGLERRLPAKVAEAKTAKKTSKKAAAKSGEGEASEKKAASAKAGRGPSAKKAKK